MGWVSRIAEFFLPVSKSRRIRKLFVFILYNTLMPRGKYPDLQSPSHLSPIPYYTLLPIPIHTHHPKESPSQPNPPSPHTIHPPSSLPPNHLFIFPLPLQELRKSLHHILPLLPPTHQPPHHFQHLIHPTPNLHHTIPLPQRHTPILTRLKINRDRKRRPQLIITRIAFSDARRRGVDGEGDVQGAETGGDGG